MTERPPGSAGRRRSTSRVAERMDAMIAETATRSGRVRNRSPASSRPGRDGAHHCITSSSGQLGASATRSRRRRPPTGTGPGRGDSPGHREGHDWAARPRRAAARIWRPSPRPLIASRSARRPSSQPSPAGSARRAPRSRSSYLSATTLRLTFSVGVSSPPSWERSCGQDLELLDLLDAGELLVDLVEWAWIESLDLGFSQLGGSSARPFSSANFGASSGSSVTSATR